MWRHVAFGVICGHVPASDIVSSSAVWKAVCLIRHEDLGTKAHVIGSWSGVTMAKWSMLAPDVRTGLFRTERRDMIEHADVRIERGKSVYWVGLGVDWSCLGGQNGRVHLWCGTVHGQVMAGLLGVTICVTVPDPASSGTRVLTMFSLFRWWTSTGTSAA